MALTWNDLFAKGAIVDLNTGVWRARTTLRPEDLGIEVTEEVRKAFSMGCHRLAPRGSFEEVNRIVRGAYERVESLSLPFGLIRGARYVPEGTLPRLLDDLELARTNFDAAVAEFLAGYEDMKAEMLPILRTALDHAAKTGEAAQIAFDRLRTEYPSRSEVARRFRLEWTSYAISGPQTMAAGQALEKETGQVRKIVHQMVRRLRDEMSEKLEDVIGMAARGGKLPEPSVQSAKELIGRLEAMNILGDEDLTRALRTFRGLIEAAASGQMDTGFHTTLVQVKDLMAGSLADAQKKAEQALTGVGKRRIKT